VVFVDLTPGALLNRLDRGVVYAPDKAKRARENFFREPTLVALRELALRQTAHEVDLRQPEGAVESAAAERILIHICEDPATIGLIRRGRRVADYLRADCFAVCVARGEGLQGLPEEAREAVERHLNFARMLHIDTRVLNAEDPAEALAAFAHTNGITQIFLTKPKAAGMPLLGARKLLAMRLIRAARDIQVTLVADRTPRSG
jgi:two-component system sensor histidine kinase KdpD